ncbi:TonB-dependent receptor [Gilvibacter sediminis]|uniref:TonB-dependent receptor n=1 Tax=Gilvibacter sediminis TaxID=379071 RepID=UPI002350266C|nr:TonB-dependent receptor [Gilvibacter sediminis]MDC7998239.1 TonB-dependent receptor [Gilvibacter sediminis]
MNKLLFTAGLCLCTLCAIAQDCQLVLSGSVIDSHENTALSGATLSIVGTAQIAYTDLDGRFSFADLCPAIYTLEIQHPECKTERFEINLRKDTDRTLFMEHHLEALNEVLITGRSFKTQSETQLNNTLELAEIEKYSSGSLGDVLNTLSGVSSLNTGNTVVKPVINGLHSSRVSIINNGVRLQDQEWGAEHAPNIDINSAGQITVLKGASTLQYSGNAVGGVIIAEPRRVLLTDTLYGKTILTGATNGRGGSITSELFKGYESGWYGAIQGTAKRFGDFEAPDYVLSNTGIEEGDFSLRLGKNTINSGFEAYMSYFQTTIGILRASHLGGASDQVAAIGSDRPLIIEDFTYDILVPRQEVKHLTGRLSYFKQFENLGKLSLQYDVQWNQRFEFDVRRGDNRNRAAVDLELTTHNFVASLESKLTDDFGINTGLNWIYQENVADPSTGVRRLIPDYEQYTLGAFAIADWKVSDRLLFEAGIRFDYTLMDVFKFYRNSFWEGRGYDEEFADIVIEETGTQVLVNPELEFNNWAATAGLNYKIDDSYRLYFNYALATRAPNASELFSEGLHHSASRIELGDLRFNSEVANRISVSLEKQGERFSFTAAPFVNWIEDFILIEPTGVQQTIRGNFQVWEYRQTAALLTGVDLDANYQFNQNWSTRAQFSLVKGYDQTRDLPLINMPPASLNNAIRFNKPEWFNFQTGIESQYVFRQNEFPDNNFTVFVPETDQNELVDVSTPPDAYQLWNWDASATFKINEKSDLQLGLQITNLFNTSYRNYLNRLRYYADDLGRNVRLNLKINY